MAQEVPMIERGAREDVEGERISSPRGNWSTQGSDAQTGRVAPEERSLKYIKDTAQEKDTQIVI